MKKLTLTAAFAQFGATLKNPRWACSALAQDGSLVISCWSEFLKSQPNGGQRYEYSLSSQWGEGNRLGRELLIRHLHTAFNHALPVSASRRDSGQARRLEGHNDGRLPLSKNIFYLSTIGRSSRGIRQ